MTIPNRWLAIFIFTVGLWVGPAHSEKVLLASTTSLDNSGFYKYILPRFTADTGVQVLVIAVGTGKAIAIAEKGDADLLIVHDRKSELAFMAAGYGLTCTPFMYNQYVIVGPPENPAAIEQDMRIGDVMQSISKTESIFVSRGDDSGTHKKELSLWEIAGLSPHAKDRWYYEVGRGMGTVLTMANEIPAYTLSDYATWLSFNHRANLRVLFNRKEYMYNPYSIILLNPKRYAHLNNAGAERFAKWLTSDKGLAAIASFRVKDRQVFYPIRGTKPCRPL